MKKLVLVLTICCLSFLFAQTPRYGGVLVFGRSGDSVSLDPAHALDTESFPAISAVYDGLVQFKYGTTKIIPALAKSWKISKDGLRYTFYLRKGVHFSKTSYYPKSPELTSADVVFSFKRQFDKNNPYHKIGGAFKYWSSMDMSKIVKDVKALDKYTVEIVLKKKEAPLVSDLAMSFAVIVSKDYAYFLLKKGKANDFAKKPVGTGPFVFQKWIKDDRTIFTANKNYWNGRPYVNKLIFKVITNSSVREAELETGAISIMDFPNPADVPSLEANKKIKVIKQAGLNVGYLAFNTSKKPFNNLLVRRALSYAIDTKDIVKSIYEGLGKAIANPIPPTQWSYNKHLKGYPYNIKKAKALLAKAGYPHGFKTNIWAMPVARPYMPDGRKVAEVIQADLAKIGVQAKIVTYDWGTYLAKTSAGEHDMALLGWTGSNGDPDNFLNNTLSKQSAMQKPSQNIAFWKNDKFTKLIDEAKVISNIAKRTKLYKKAQVIFDEQAPWKPIANSIVAEPMLKKVHGFKLDPVGTRRFKEVWLSK